MRQRILAMSTSRRKDVLLGSVASQYLVGSSSPSGHSTSSVSSARSLARRIGEVRTRTRAKRDASRSFVPSRHVTVRQAPLGKPSASSLALTRGPGLPLSVTACTLIVGTMPATYLSASAPTPPRKALLEP